MKKQKRIKGKHAGIPGRLSGNDPSYHVPVLLQETIDHLSLQPSGIYVDCTFGGGGHSKAILQQLGPAGKIIAFDQDPDARQNLPDDDRIIFVASNFRYLQRFLRLHGFEKVDGILADLGVSSHQFDEAGRGFSIRFDASLDMRMDQRQTTTASNVLHGFSEQQLHKMFEQYGEVSNSKTLARTIVEARVVSPLQTIENLKAVLKPIVKGNPNKYLAQVFQALRIEVNDELGALKEMLEQVPAVLNKDGRIAVITFHSIEDRIVKKFFRYNSFNEVDENPFSTEERTISLKPVNKKPVVASEHEIKINPRSRSAKLRVAQKI